MLEYDERAAHNHSAFAVFTALICAQFYLVTFTLNTSRRGHQGPVERFPEAGGLVSTGKHMFRQGESGRGAQCVV